VFVYIYSQSIQLTIIPLACSLIAVIWQLGLLVVLGVRHRPDVDPGAVPRLRDLGQPSVQMVSAHGAEVYTGANSEEAARAAFRKLLLPGASRSPPTPSASSRSC